MGSSTSTLPQSGALEEDPTTAPDSSVPNHDIELQGIEDMGLEYESTTLGTAERIPTLIQEQPTPTSEHDIWVKHQGRRLKLIRAFIRELNNTLKILTLAIHLTALINRASLHIFHVNIAWSICVLAQLAQRRLPRHPPLQTRHLRNDLSPPRSPRPPP